MKFLIASPGPRAAKPPSMMNWEHSSIRGVNRNIGYSEESTCLCLCGSGSAGKIMEYEQRGPAPPKVKPTAKSFSPTTMAAGAGPKFVNINFFRMSDYLLSALRTTQAKWTGAKFVNNSSWLGHAVAKGAERPERAGACRHSSKTHHDEGLNPRQGGLVTIEESLCCHITPEYPSQPSPQSRSSRGGDLGEKGDHKITEWFGLGRTLKTISFPPPAMGRDIFHYPRLLQAPSNLAWDTSRDGAATDALSDLCQGLSTLTVTVTFLLVLCVFVRHP
ncbi:hypothetical protein DUI87_24760 [Hirundo rustica rustica]|uniref:Uncharacterized protein n=1 Tax=Hirundo rustica rustica TaxID=333673 RepID=A0A3M0JUE9_HIRRU|nr:hypothetical protein DUI87_24760 [Hirundo rustica rustica]